MLFRQMKYFVAVVDCNSFTEAAEQCYAAGLHPRRGAAEPAASAAGEHPGYPSRLPAGQALQ